MAYVIDSDVFIRSKNEHYGFDICPAFWDWIVAAAGAGTARSVERIGDELKAGNDDLAKWARKHSSIFLKPDAAVNRTLGSLTAWVQAQTAYTPAMQAEFFKSGDFFLIGHALAHAETVVSFEHGRRAGKIKIPEVCKGMNVPCRPPHAMLRAEGAQFVLP
jgi:hypothetical protein